MKSKNHVITSTDQEHLKGLFDEYRYYCGREAKLTEGKLTVFALPQPKPKRAAVKKEDPKDDKPERWSKRERDYGKED